MKFTQILQKENKEILNNIYNHPFLRELKEGILPIKKFQTYVKQNVYYLKEYARALALLGTRCRDHDDLTMFIDFSRNVLINEMGRQVKFSKSIGLSLQDLLNVIPFENTLSYNAFEYKMCLIESLPVAAASLTPCYHIYGNIGRIMFKGIQKSYGVTDEMLELYSYYSTDVFINNQKSITSFIDREVEKATKKKEERKWARIAYRTSCEYEYKFFDVPYHYKE